MSLVEVNTPQEEHLRNAIRKAEDDRRRLQEAGFKTCTDGRNSRMCSRVQGVEFRESTLKVLCGRAKDWLSQPETEKCLKPCLMTTPV